ncbi:CoA pyrophosphatase [Phenylobacterium sp.]|uniref:CoA pyrophosphatase n=1 Tax=Phenylobacterium sp. TaxID=1871053 RepID=UPI002733360A|nr:CoA pyrophosphatase [Phenylobacterium sp.]MDP3853064.1 CoA pyrophosphatase [Phenylobacterium sp.]
MSPHSAPGELRAWIERHLDPLEEREASQASSDFDLTPNAFPNEPVELVPAAVLVGLIQRDHGFSVLLTRRSDTMRRHTGQVALPGGRCDPGESVWQTALREAHEEVGLHPDFVSLAGLSSPYRTGTGYLVTPVVGFVREGFSLTANPDEVADIFETPFGFLMDPVNYEEHEREAPDGQKRRFYAMTHEDQYIWGATAGMLRALYDRLYGAAVA